jgi:predicted ATPase
LVDETRKRRGNIEPGVGRWVSYLNREKKLDTFVGQKPVAPVAPKGLYLYGNVGSGKLINTFTWPARLEFAVSCQVSPHISSVS